MQDTLEKHAEKIKSLKKTINVYRVKYYDVDINELHKKIQFLSTECDIINKINLNLNQYLKGIQ